MRCDARMIKVKHLAMKMQEVVEVKVYTSLTLAPDGDE
jgi:hypothetical protein